MNENPEEQERQEIPYWLRNTMTILGIVFILTGLTAIGLYFWDIKKFPSPSDLGTNFIMGLGILLLLVAHFPWSKIKFGDFEIERAIQEQAQDYSLEIEKLTQELIECKKSSNINRVNSDSEAFNFETFNHYIDNKENIKNLLIKFLKEWKSYGFTVSRIKKWGGEQNAYELFKDMSNTELRMILDELLRDGKVKTRLSRGGNILYQYK